MAIRNFLVCVLGLEGGKITIEINSAHTVAQLREDIWKKIKEDDLLEGIPPHRLRLYKATPRCGLLFGDPDLEKHGQRYVKELVENERTAGGTEAKPHAAEIDPGQTIDSVFDNEYWTSLLGQNLVHVFVDLPRRDGLTPSSSGETFEPLPSTDLFYDIYKKFWGKPLRFEYQTVIITDDDGRPVKNSFNVLEINSHFFNSTKGKMIVRQEYFDAVKILNERFALYPTWGAIMLGHPGIGKSWFLYYLLVLRLSQQMATIINLDPAGDTILFHSNGCYRFIGKTVNNLNKSSMTDHVWALVDSPSPNLPPNPILTSKYADVFTVYSSSPNEARYKYIAREKQCRFHVMQPWSFGEIWAGAMLRRSPNETDQEVLRSQYWKYGPSARNLYNLYDGELKSEELDLDIKNAIKNIETEKLDDLIKTATGAESTTDQRRISHNVILAYPHPNLRTRMTAGVITHHVFLLLADRLFMKGFEELVKTYRLFHDIDALSVSTGWAFEYYCHRMLSDHGGRELTLIPLTIIRHTTRKDGSFNLCRPNKNVPPLPFSIPERQRHHFQNGETLTLSNDKYFIPTQINKPAYDGFLAREDQALNPPLNNQIFVFQMTMQDEHDVKPAGIYDLHKYVGDRPVTFVLLIPQERQHDDIKLAVPKEIIAKATYYMSVVEVRAEA